MKSYEHELYREIDFLNLQIKQLELAKNVARIENPYYPTNAINAKIGGYKNKRKKVQNKLRTVYIQPRYRNV